MRGIKTIVTGLILLSVLSLTLDAGAQSGVRAGGIAPSPVSSEKLRTAQAASPGTEGSQEQTGPVSPSEPLVLSLQDCIGMALKNNLEIAVESYNPKISAQEIGKEKAAFEPLLFGGGSYSENRLPTNSGLYLTVYGIDSDQSDTRDWTLGWSQRLVTGTSYEISYANRRFYSLLDPEVTEEFYIYNPDYTSVLSLKLSQPLLKDFGIDINKTRIYIAQNNEKISFQQFRSRVFAVIAEVQIRYWGLAAAIENLEVNRRSLKLAQDLLEINKAKVKAGTLAPLEVVAAEAEVATREEGVIVAENLIKQVEDLLRRAINLPDEPQMWERPIKPGDKATFEPQELSMEASVKRALDLRPELTQAKIDLANKDIEKRYAKNQLYPTLNLQGSAGLNGIGDTYWDNFRAVRGGDYYSYSVGLVVEFPLTNRFARSEYARASLDQEKSKTNLVNLEQQITVEIREVIRQIQTNSKRIDATQKALTLARKRLEVEEKKLGVGMSTNFEVLRIQRDLVEAETNALRALLDYKISIVALERVEGTILERHNIELKES